MKLIISARAQNDLDAIAEYIAQDNLPAAERLIGRLADKFDRIRANPGIGSPRSELMRDLRGHAFGRYIISYRARRDELEIVRVVHGARDQQRAFLDDPDQ